MDNNIILKNAILHILDTNINLPVLSNTEMQLNPDLNKFIISHINRLLKSDNYKKCIFKDNSPLLDKIKSFTNTYDNNNFINLSKEIANNFFTIMLRNLKIPSADLIISIININEIDYLAIIKLNYRNSFIHLVQNKEGLTNNTIIKQLTALPSDISKLEEAVLIDLNNLNIKLLEKVYKIDGSKDYYISAYILRCTDNISDKNKLKTILKTAYDINQKYYNNDKNHESEVNVAIANGIYDKKEVLIEDLCKDIYIDSPEIKTEFFEILNNNKINKNENLDLSEISLKKFEKQYIKTSNGIEVKIPISLYNDYDKIEFINNPNGTISLLIKNIY